MGFPFGPVFKLLMLTGQRRAEVAGMRWSELDLTAGLWRIPAERAKNKQAHELDLSPEALAIIRQVKELRLNSDVLFPARGEGAVRGFSATKRKLDAMIEDLRRQDAADAGDDPPTEPLPAWRTHDLRRTAATGMAAMAFPPHVVERVLNHVSGTQSGLFGGEHARRRAPRRPAHALECDRSGRPGGLARRLGPAPAASPPAPPGDHCGPMGPTAYGLSGDALIARRILIIACR